MISVWLQARKDVEGSLFVVKRSAQPRFQFIVMNRRSTENLVEDLLSDLEFEIQVPYLLYRNAAEEVNGIWFYNSQECEEIFDLFNRIINVHLKAPAKQDATPSKREFKELEAVPTCAAIEGALELSIKPSTSTVQQEDPSFMKFFNKSMNVGNNFSNGPQSGQLHPNSSPTSTLSHVPFAHSSHVPTLQIPTLPPASYLSPSTMTPNGRSDLLHSSNSVANLVKPSSFVATSPSSSFFMAPVSSTATTALPPLLTPQQPHGAPMLQPFPPPTQPPTYTTAVMNYTPLNREKVSDALRMLVQDDQFVDMVYRALLKVNHS
ncbi:OLC1v1034144C3 [Oldenlandia corymbosa var. corymbosa]|uniref:OLC1v1034144C3 n=1 Tax=Oldenlandia corymbosa var. corymbosa TaxID=529605 RepID=A0AAV1CSI8_OLDCO|nr:OLC1v1034144C3 [Oldenlandia corymbosa var. corymbosa]